MSPIPDYDAQTRDLSFEDLRKLGTQDPARSAYPRDYTYDYDQNMNRVQRIYFATFAPGKLAQAIRDQLHRLDYETVTIFGDKKKTIHHIYASKDD